ncbi:MAG: SusC/RagA family TonB-linked outer membrane protein [Odoribacteraceae bacterium]|jgi:TonB-linked SusC/RagA family outer membrane protein|nr:SusC/RagA family TonB-linked outer membrane protein [Odoribacteraceae bacterium]
MKKILVCMLAFLHFALPSVAQETGETRVSGKVTGADGESLPGVAVLLVGSRRGAVTDGRGEFSLEVAGDAVLQFSFIGFKTLEVAVNGRQRVEVTLEEEVSRLDEVIVVAYGTAKRESFTGSIATIKEEKLASRQVSNVTGALSGQVAGVQVRAGNGQPGVTSTVRVRGVGSMSAGNAPLYVVDGVPYDGDISSISGADIESVNILKDAASNALYGARGANGVVLITTKRAKTRDAVVSVNARWGSNSRAVPNYAVLKDAGAYLEKVYEAMFNGFSDSQSAADAHLSVLRDIATNSNGGVGYQVHSVPAGEALFGSDGRLNPKATIGYSDGKYTYRPDDWYGELFDSKNLRQEYNVSISGSTEKLNYYLSLGLLDDTGIMSGSGFKRYSSRANVEYQAKSWLQVGSKIAYTRYDMQYPPNQTSSGNSTNLFYLANNIAPIYPLYARDSTGNIHRDARGFTVYDFGDQTSGNFKRTFMSGSNPASLSKLDKRAYGADVFSGRWFAVVELMKGLKFTYNFGADTDNTRYSRLYNAYYGQYSKVGGIAYVGHTRTASVNHQQLLGYSVAFGDAHAVEALLGHESYALEIKELVASKEKLYNPAIVEIDNGILNPSASSGTDKYKTEGWFGRVQYEYDHSYIVSLSYRRDASSRFRANHRWGDFGSVGGAWVVSREPFLAPAAWIDFLKAKASYGIQGNDDLLYQDGDKNYYPDRDQYALSESNGDFALTMTYKGNPDITWETSRSFNAGIDFSLWRGRLAGTLEYFSRLTDDMLYYRPVSPSGGYSVLPSNIGKVTNRGVELGLNSALAPAAWMKITLFANATLLGNKIKKLAPELGGTLIDGTEIFQEGKSMYRLYFPRYVGVAQDGRALYQVEDKDAPAVVTTTEWPLATKYATADLLPRLYGGFGFTVDAGGFDLSFSAAYQVGGKIYDSGYQALMHSGSARDAGHNWHRDILQSWSPARATNTPRVGANDAYTNSNSDRFLVSSNYLDITNITLGYSIPSTLLQRLELAELRLYCAAENVLLLAKRKGLDPRQSYTSANAARYSPIRAISGGLSLKF